MMSERAIIFDLDGTLVDSSPGIATALSSAFSAVGRTMPFRDLRRVIGPPIKVIAKRLEPTLTDNELSIVESVYRSQYDLKAWSETSLFEGVPEGLRTLRTWGWRLFIVTNKPHLPTIKILSQFGLGPLFDEVLTRDISYPPYRTKAAMVADLVRSHSLSIGKTIMVGDTLEDEEAAHSNNLDFVFARYGYGNLPRASVSIEQFTNLLDANTENL